ncbi:MAG: hypothetical protein Q8N34_03300 [Gammaproteobacteria bacterium]|nr:hypothetical protein [Gammaproteobacteria bacterium]
MELMEWKVGDRYYQFTDKGYNVTLAYNGIEEIYTAFGPKLYCEIRRQFVWINILQSRLSSFEEAKAVCQADYDRRVAEEAVSGKKPKTATD